MHEEGGCEDQPVSTWRAWKMCGQRNVNAMECEYGMWIWFVQQSMLNEMLWAVLYHM